MLRLVVEPGATYHLDMIQIHVDNVMVWRGTRGEYSAAIAKPFKALKAA